MSELSRGRAQRQIWITRSHLAALGVATCCIATLAFLVGMQVGRSQAAAAEVVAEGTLPLTPDVDQEEALEALLREVEYARSAVGPNGMLARETTPDLAFPELLEPVEPEPDSVLPSSEAVASATLALPEAETAPLSPSALGASATAGPSPSGQWAIQVASFPSAAEADVRMRELEEKGYQVFRVAALVDGQTWHRVRVGGYPDRARAEAARRELQLELGTDDLILAELR